jgi:hypothetical protein
LEVDFELESEFLFDLESEFLFDLDFQLEPEPELEFELQ